MNREIEIQRPYRHFKGKLYYVHQIVTHTETEEILVSYQALYPPYGMFVRPLEMFMEKVDPGRKDNYTNQVYKYYKDVHNRESYDGKGADIYSYVNVLNPETGGNWSNAAWTGAEMIYGDGNPKTEYPFTAANDVVAHEITHGVTSSTADLVYEFQPGALNESFSDVFGYFVDHEDWTMGEDLYKAPNTAMRSLKEPRKYNQPDHMRNYLNLNINTDHGGVHINSGIPNKAAYNTITKLGKEKSEQIYYRALTKYLTKQSDFSEASQALIQSAKDLYGTNEASIVKQAWSSVGVY